MTAVRGRLGSANRLSLSAGFAAWRRGGHEQLVNPLMRDAQDGCGIAHADPTVRQGRGGFLVCSTASRSAERACCRAWRACSTVLSVALGSSGLGTSSIWSSPIWNHSAAASRMRARAWSTVLPQVWTVAPLRARRTSARPSPVRGGPYRCARSPLSSCCRWSLGEPPRAEAGLKVPLDRAERARGQVPGVDGDHRLAVTAPPDLVGAPLAHGLAASLPQLADQHPGGHRCSLSA